MNHHSIEQTQDAIPKLVSLLFHKDPQIVANVAHTLSHLVNHTQEMAWQTSPELMDRLLDLLSHPHSDVSVNTAHLIATLVFFKDNQTKIEKTEGAFETMISLLDHANPKLASSALHVLSVLVKNEDTQVKIRQTPGVIKKSLPFLDHADASLAQKATRTLAHIAALPDNQFNVAQALLDPSLSAQVLINGFTIFRSYSSFLTTVFETTFRHTPTEDTNEKRLKRALSLHVPGYQPAKTGSSLFHARKEGYAVFQEDISSTAAHAATLLELTKKYRIACKAQEKEIRDIEAHIQAISLLSGQ